MKLSQLKRFCCGLPRGLYAWILKYFTIASSLFFGLLLIAGISKANDTLYKPAVVKSQPTYPGTAKKTCAKPVAGPNVPVTLKTSRRRLVGIDAIDAANARAVRQPNSSNYMNSLLTFDYVPGALYQVYCAPFNVTDIEFQNNEHIISAAAGDTVRWQVSKTFSGSGVNRHEHLLVKPNDEGLVNSLVVTTDQRTYHVLLHSTARTYMPSVQWHYPDTDMVQNFDDNPSGNTLSDLGQNLDLNRLDFNYSVTLARGLKDKPEWFPTMVFNDGNKTYIKFPKKIQEAPTLFIGNSADVVNNKITNYRIVGNYYIVDSLFPRSQLRSGDGRSQIIVQINYVFGRK